MKKIILISLMVSTSYLNLAYAQTIKVIKDCEKQLEKRIEYSQCLDRVKEVTNRELQTWVNNQTFILEEFALKTGRKSALEMFRRSQRNFITFRENNCRWQYLANSPSISAAPAYKKCYIRVSKTRIKELSQLDKSTK